MAPGKSNFKFRRFITTLMGLSFLGSLVTGMVLYITPPGSVARVNNWTLVGLGKEQWDAQHICFSVVFAAAGLIHLMYNWQSLINCC